MEIDGSMDILLIDSNGYDAELTARVLRRAVANPIRMAKDGPRALGMLYDGANGFAKPLRPQLIVMDVHVRLTDPFDVLQRFRTEPSTCEVPVILLTSTEAETETLRARVPDRCVVMTKPVELAQMIEALASLQASWVLLNDNPVVVANMVWVGAK